MRIVKLKPREKDQHDQQVLLGMARHARDGMDIVEMERALRIVGVLIKDKNNQPIDDGRPYGDISFRDKVQLEEADWELLRARFASARWQTALPWLLDLKAALYEAEQVPVSDPKSKK